MSPVAGKDVDDRRCRGRRSTAGSLIEKRTLLVEGAKQDERCESKPSRVEAEEANPCLARSNPVSAVEICVLVSLDLHSEAPSSNRPRE